MTTLYENTLPLPVEYKELNQKINPSGGSWILRPPPGRWAYRVTEYANGCSVEMGESFNSAFPRVIGSVVPLECLPREVQERIAVLRMMPVGIEGVVDLEREPGMRWIRRVDSKATELDIIKFAFYVEIEA